MNPLNDLRMRLLTAVLASTTVLMPRVATASSPQRARTVLAAGDSFSSGHGAQGATLDSCHTNPSAWALQAIADSSVRLVPGGLTFVACSGARTTDFTIQWDGKTRYDLVMFTFGGDDLDFGTVIVNCLTRRCPTDTEERTAIQTVRDHYAALLDNVARATRPGGNVLVLGYPDILANPNMWHGLAKLTGVCNGIWYGDANRIRGWAGDLNATIGQEVQDYASTHLDYHFTFLNVDDRAVTPGDSQYLWEPPGASKVHTLCGNDTPWLNGLNPPDWRSSYRISFHPDLAGLAAEGQLAANAINRMDWSGLAPPAQGPAPAAPPPMPSPGNATVNLAQGPAAPSGFRYTIRLAHFQSDTPVNVECFDSSSTEGFYSFTLTPDTSGSAAISSTSCYSGDGPDHWVVAGGIASNHVQWGSSALPPGISSPPTQPPAYPPTQPAPPSLPAPAAPAPVESLQIGWSGAHPTWIWLTLTGFPTGSYTYTCNFGSGGAQSFVLSVTTGSQMFDNAHTCYDSIPSDTVWVTIGSVRSNTLTVGGSAPPPPSTVAETSGGVLHTWTNRSNAGGTQGPSVPAFDTIQIACKLTGFTVSDGNSWWYRISSSPWSGTFYASADGFYNNGATSGSLRGTPFVDPNVPNC